MTREAIIKVVYVIGLWKCMRKKKDFADWTWTELRVFSIVIFGNCSLRLSL